MNDRKQLNDFSQQVQTVLELAYENILAFKRYKGTPVIIEWDGRVVHVDHNEMPPASQSAA